VDHGGYHIQVGSHMVDCSRNGYNRQNRMTTSFPVDEATTYVANPFGGELYIRAPYGSLISTADVSVTGDVVQGATFFYSSLRNTTEEEWIDLQNSPAPWVHVVTDPFLQQWHSGPVKQQSYSFMVERARRYTVAYNAASLTAGIPPERRNTWFCSMRTPRTSAEEPVSVPSDTRRPTKRCQGPLMDLSGVDMNSISKIL